MKKFNVKGFEKTWVIAKNLGQLGAIIDLGDILMRKGLFKPGKYYCEKPC